MLDNVMALLPTNAHSSEVDPVRVKKTRQIKGIRPSLVVNELPPYRWNKQVFG